MAVIGDAVGGSARRERPGKVAILRAAVAVMGEDGYEGASMRDMANRAGVSVAALYYHFPSKHDLLLEFLDEAYDVTLRRVDRRLLAVGPSPTDRLDEMVATLIATYIHDEYAQLASTVALREFTRLDPTARTAIDAKRNLVVDRVIDILRDGVECGEFDIDEPGATGHAIAALCASVIEPYASSSRSMTEVIGLYQGFARALVGAPRRTG